MTSNYEGGLSGLVNLGNTCYMNAAIQCLSNTNDLTNYFLSKDFVNDFNKGKKTNRLAKEWYKLLNGLHEENCIVSPKSFHRTIVELSSECGINFGYTNQNDVQEFLVFFIDGLHESLCKEVIITISGKVVNPIDKMALDAMTQWKQFFKNNYSKIIQMFYGQMVSRIFVENVVRSASYSPMCFFTLPIPTSTQDGSINIIDCFNEFTKPETLNGDNQWKDDDGHFHDAVKKIDIWDFPQIMIVCLKRFDNFGRKRNDLIDFPVDNLDLTDYCIGYNKYKSHFELYGICNHTGGAGFGHYYAYCRFKDDNWYAFNDRSVNKISPDKLVTNSAYCLFYRKKKL
jgi:ubiquitin carboxyl-terminal hydrolase 8